MVVFVHELDLIPTSPLRLVQRLIGELQHASRGALERRSGNGGTDADGDAIGDAGGLMRNVQLLDRQAHTLGGLSDRLVIEIVEDGRKLLAAVARQ
jgi:hypothetical protein